MTSCGGSRFYQRNGLLHAPLNALAACAAALGKRLIFGMDKEAPGPIHERCHYATLPDFEAADYQALCRAHLGDAAEVDGQKVFRFARAERPPDQGGLPGAARRGRGGGRRPLY